MEKPTIPQNQASSPPSLQIKIVRGKADKAQYIFDIPFKIGRGEDCPVTFDEEIVSRVHAEVKLENGQWWLEDLNSTNGTFLNGQRINRAQLVSGSEIEFGKNGPIILCSLSQPDTASNDDHSVTRYVEHYFNDKQDTTEAGEHTRMMRAAFGRVQKKYTLKYYIIIGFVLFLFIIAGSYSIYQHSKANEARS